MIFAKADSLILLRLLCLRAFSVAEVLGVGSVAGGLNRLRLVVQELNIRSWERITLEVEGYRGCLFLFGLVRGVLLGWENRCQMGVFRSLVLSKSCFLLFE